MLKTENVVILFTDIAGFTESTSLQSREQNRRLLDRHNSILLPIVRRFRGRHIKSIGDALLLIFTSPTDAMRCAMAMQDALHEYNLSSKVDEQIHIRVAASLGEVRVTKSDIFGEPVNVTSRIEGITPPDEIYFSEAVYLAMNKAEVPALEIGLHELKGISKPVRIFAIPRFAENRLVPQNLQPPTEGSGLSYPYGGMHLAIGPVSSSWMDRITTEGQRFVPPGRAWPMMGGASVALAAVGLFLLSRSGESDGSRQGARPRPPGRMVSNSVVSNSDARAALKEDIAVIPVATPVSTSTSLPAVNPEGVILAPTRIPLPTFTVVPTSAPTVAPTAMPTLIPTIVPTTVSVVASPAGVASGATTSRMVESGTKKPVPAASVVRPQIPKAPQIYNILQAKAAYRANRIDKAAYRNIVARLESELDARVRDAKIQYNAGKFSKDVLRQKITALKIRYIGSD